MSLLNDASLVVVPSGYKAGTVYSVKPTNGDGDLSFTRSNDTATRVNSAGLIERVRTNLLAYSEQFDNAYWDKSRINAFGSGSIANATTAPDGTMTADYIQQQTGETSRGGVFKGFTTVSGTVYTLSVFAKKSDSNFLQLGAAWITAGDFAEFNLDTGTVGTVASGLTARIVDFGNGWYRCSITGAAAFSGARNHFIYQNEVPTAVPDTGIFIWGAQLEVSDFGATDYIPTTSAAVSVGMLANVPRLDYSGGGCPKLLLEPQRTNLVTFSEQFNNADWGKSNAIITANDTASPDGYTNADKITDNANNNQHRVTQNISVTNGTSYTASIFVKNDDKGDFTINFTATGFPSTKIVFNLINGTVTSGTGTIEDYGNGWYRISATAAANITGSGTIGFNLGDGGAYVGTGESVFIWGAQIESGSYPTSYIPTLSAAVTRGADACFKTGISSLIGQTEGVLYVEVAAIANEATNKRISISDGTNNNRVSVSFTTGINVFVISGGVTQVANSLGITTPEEKHKIALAYKDNDFVVYVDGVQVFVSTSGDVPVSLTEFKFSDGTGSPFFGNLDQSILFPTRLTNDELADLTTL